MARTLAVLGLLVVLAPCGAGAWAAMRAPLAPFLVDGAGDLRVAALAWNEWQINYSAPPSWYTTVIEQLEDQGWSSTDRAEYAPLSRVYMRATRLGPFALWEWAFLRLEPLKPHMAQIRVRRWIAIPALSRGGDFSAAAM
jgi:hypothetical protein